MTNEEREHVAEMVELGVGLEAATKMATTFCKVPEVMEADGWIKTDDWPGQRCGQEGHSPQRTLFWEKNGRKAVTIGTCCGCLPPCCEDDLD